MNLSINKNENTASQVRCQTNNEICENYHNDLNSQSEVMNNLSEFQQQSYPVLNNYCATGPYAYRNSPLTHPMQQEPEMYARYDTQDEDENVMEYDQNQFVQETSEFTVNTNTDPNVAEETSPETTENPSLLIHQQKLELESLKSTLNQVVADNEEKTEMIQNQKQLISNLQSDSVQLQHGIQQANSKMQQMFYTATDIGYELREKTKELTHTKSKLDQVSSLLEESIDKVVYILQRCEMLEEELYHMQSDLESQKTTHKNEMDGVNSENERLHSEHVSLIEKFQTQKSNDEQIIEAFKALTQTDRAKISMLKTKLEKFEVENLELRKKTATLKISEKQQLTAKIAKLKLQNVEQASRIKQLQQSCDENAQQVECLGDQIISIHKERKSKLHEKPVKEQINTSKSKIPARVRGTNRR